MAKRRPRLVPKVVFRVALTATAVPLLGGCPREHLTVANRGYGVAEMSYGPVAQRAYDATAVEDAAPVAPQPGVAAPAFVNPAPVDASVAPSAASTDAGKLDAGKLDAAKVDAGKLDAGKRDAAVASPSLTAHPPVPGVAYRGYDVVGVAYRGYDGTKPPGTAGPPGPPPAKP